MPGWGSWPGPIAHSSRGPRCDGDTRRVGPQPPRPGGLWRVVRKSREPRSSSADTASRYVSRMMPSGHRWRGRAPKAHPPWGGPGEGGVPGVPPLSAPGALYLRVSASFTHSGLWKHRSQLLGSGLQRSPESRNPQAVLSAQKQPVPSLLEFEPSAACTRPWGRPTPSLTPDPAVRVLFSP